MHVDDRDEVALAVQQRRRRKTRYIGGSRFYVVVSSMATTHIYWEDPRRGTTSRNRLGLSIKTYQTQTYSKKITKGSRVPVRLWT
jgi:hypothetical protein